MITTRHRFTLMAVLLIGSVLGLSSCYETTTATNTAPVPQAPISLTATLNGAQEKPTSTTSTGSGTFAGSIDRTTRVLSYTVTYGGLTAPPIGGHLHRITNPDGTGPVTIPFAQLTSPIIGTTSTLRQTQIDSMVAGQFYANIHTPLFPAGEIRGDIRVR